MFFLTPAETALGGVVLGGLISAASSAWVLRGNRRGDHAKRLWERRVELHADMLRQAQFMRGGVDGMYGPLAEDREQAADLAIRFAMFGDEDVWRAYETFRTRHKTWLEVRQRVDFWQGTDVPSEREKDAASHAGQEVDDAYHELLAAVGEATQAVPRVEPQRD